MLTLTDPNYKYANAEESREPGYLKKKFAKIVRDQKLRERKATEAHHARVLSVRTIGSAR